MTDAEIDEQAVLLSHESPFPAWRISFALRAILKIGGSIEAAREVVLSAARCGIDCLTLADNIANTFKNLPH
jgi:hypothetical protein